MIQEFQQVVLTEDWPADGMKAGDVGTVVDITRDTAELTLEFFDFQGRTVAVIPVLRHQVRPLAPTEVMQARPRQ